MAERPCLGKEWLMYGWGESQVNDGRVPTASLEGITAGPWGSPGRPQLSQNSTKMKIPLPSLLSNVSLKIQNTPQNPSRKSFRRSWIFIDFVHHFNLHKIRHPEKKCLSHVESWRWWICCVGLMWSFPSSPRRNCLNDRLSLHNTQTLMATTWNNISLGNYLHFFFFLQAVRTLKSLSHRELGFPPWRLISFSAWQLLPWPGALI